MMSRGKIRRGRIYLVDLGIPGSTDSISDEAKAANLRPVLVIQNNLGNESGSTTIVVPLTSKIPSRTYPFHVMLPAEILGKPGVVMCEHIWTVSLDRLDPRAVAECPVELMDRVDVALRHSLGLSVETGRCYGNLE